MEPPFDLTAPEVQTLWGVSLLCFHESLFSASSATLIAFHWNASLTFLSILGHDCSCVSKTYLLNEYCWANEVRPSSEALVLIKPLIPFVCWKSCSKCKTKQNKTKQNPCDWCYFVGSIHEYRKIKLEESFIFIEGLQCDSGRSLLGVHW